MTSATPVALLLCLDWLLLFLLQPVLQSSDSAVELSVPLASVECGCCESDSLLSTVVPNF